MDSRLLLNSRRPSAPKAEEPAHVHLSLSAVKIMCSHFLFDMDATSRQSVVALDDSQKAVYAPTNEAPIFLGPEKNVINMEWILHCLNFFRHYMMNPHVSALHENLRDLGPSQHPSPWQGSLKPGAQKLGSSWKGTYAYLNRAELIKLRLKDDPSNTMFEDLHIDEGKYQVKNNRMILVYFRSYTNTTLVSETIFPTPRLPHMAPSLRAETALSTPDHKTHHARPAEQENRSVLLRPRLQQQHPIPRPRRGSRRPILRYGLVEPATESVRYCRMAEGDIHEAF
jgi:hypothetical protein